MNNLEQKIFTKKIDDIYNRYLSIKLLKEFYPANREHEFSKIINNREKFIKKNKELNAVVIGVEQFPNDWNISDKVRFMQSITQELPNICFAVPHNDYEYYQNEILQAMENLVSLMYEISDRYERDFLFRIDDNRNFPNCDYIRVLIGGDVEIAYQDSNVKVHKKKMKLNEAEYNRLYDYVKTYIERSIEKPLDLVVDDRCFCRCFVGRFCYEALGYKEPNTTDQSIYFDYNSKSKVVNMLRDYYLSFVDEVEKAVNMNG